ncbi:hypothetical protein [Halovivax gelatinilyticus]|uniref:hypothetical protein n=1 Tax=Halovivax gelatinilyticus TaxID=2961597 RepID=UPI0020CA8F07|nr:hypothetical protein [Halovivax gelatinilyticus]
MNPKRRAILGAVGGVAGLSALADPALAQDEKCPEWDPSYRGRTCTLTCNELPGERGDGKKKPWYESKLTFHNCSTCTRLIGARVTDGHISDKRESEPHVSDQSSVLSYHIEAGERKTFWYTGSINNFDLSEPADMNVAITQRSVERAPTEQCYRPDPDAKRTTKREKTCPEGDPEAGGRTCSLKCGELSPEFHEGKKKPWYESAITFQNCSSCTRKIAVGVSDGSIHEDKSVEPDAGHHAGSVSYHLKENERKTFWFTGSVGFLDLSEHADMNVAISQRSIEYAQSSRCYRP